ncbi:putative transcription factor ecdB [Paramyrothecium foliicola]|nr:putative transcription factor ecdB [Paramyrothecium foliicola]
MRSYPDEAQPDPPGNPDEAERRPGKRPAARGTAFYPRKRANTACQVCRARKTKCDNKRPACSYCVSVGANCIQSPMDLSSFDPASLKILERLDELERIVKESSEAQNAKLDSFATARPPPATLQSVSPLSQVSPLGSTLAKIPEILDDAPLRSILPEKVESLFSWSILVGRPHHAGHANDIPEPIHSYSPGNSSIGGLLDIEPQGLKLLLDNFFIHVHCKNPIFDETAIRHLVGKVIADGIDWSAESCLALVVCALGRIATPLGPSLDTKPGTAAFTEAKNFFDAAQKRIGMLLSQTNIIGAQCLFLSGVYMMCVFQPFQAWRFFSQALAACQALPFLQRGNKALESTVQSPSELMTVSADQVQAQAVYWSAWKSEREMRQDLVLPDFNMPHSTSVLYPPFFPTPPQALDTALPTDSERQRASWLFYLAEISLRRLSSRVCNEILQLHREASSNLAFLSELASLIPVYEAQAQRWAESLPPELSIAQPSESDNVCVFVLRGHFVNIFETIYWPFVMAHLGGLETGTVSQLPGQDFAQKGLYYHVRRIYVNEPGFLHRHHGTWPLIRGCIRSTLVLLGAGLLAADMPSGWQDAVHHVVQMLRSWEDESAELAEWRQFLQQVALSLEVS